MPERKVVIPSLVKLFASAAMLGVRARLCMFAIEASEGSLREMVVRESDALFAQCERLSRMIHRLGGDFPVCPVKLQAHASLPPGKASNATELLRELIEGHEQIMRDIGFLLAVISVQEVPGLDELLAEINETNAAWVMALENQLPGASEAAN